MRVVLTVSTSDSSSGAGIQGDLKALQAHGTYGASVITNILAENTVSVRHAMPVPVQYVTAQFEAVCDDLSVDAVKIGALPSASHVTCVTEAVRRYGLTNIVIDPTVFATGGDALSDAGTMARLRSELLPLTSCLCPNRLELGQFFGVEPLLELDDAVAAARRLLLEGVQAVLVTGGYGDGPDADDVLVTTDDVAVFSATRSRVRSIHGTGCALTSVIAAGLAHGLTLIEAVGAAKAYVTAAIQAGALLRIGQGNGPIDHTVNLPKSLSTFTSRAIPSPSVRPGAY
jgi:hydroxymethylpyrimidine/phosphomethylpyrimidine kinase